MDVRLIRRPFADLLSGRAQCLLTANTPSRRNESSYRRTKKKLNVKPESSFLFSNSSPQQDHIIFNPPASAPSVLHTPLKFLPQEDPRRKLFASATTSALAPTGAKLAPRIKEKPTGYQRHHLSEEDVAEIRRLSSSNPEKWTSNKLAKKFNCSVIFISMCCKASESRLKAEQERLEALKKRWGPKRTMAREDRARRKEMIWRDE